MGHTEEEVINDFCMQDHGHTISETKNLETNVKTNTSSILEQGQEKIVLLETKKQELESKISEIRRALEWGWLLKNNYVGLYDLVKWAIYKRDLEKFVEWDSDNSLRKKREVNAVFLRLVDLENYLSWVLHSKRVLPQNEISSRSQIQADHEKCISILFPEEWKKIREMKSMEIDRQRWYLAPLC